MDFDYSSADALELLLKKLDEREPTLAADVREAIDAGRDTVESAGRGRRKGKPYEYRKAVPFSDAEALLVAVRVLRAHFVEQPMFARSMADDLATAGVAREPEYFGARGGRNLDVWPLTLRGEAKDVEVELKTETQRTESDQETVTIRSPSPEEIRQQQDNLARLAELTALPDGIAF